MIVIAGTLSMVLCLVGGLRLFGVITNEILYWKIMGIGWNIVAIILWFLKK